MQLSEKKKVHGFVIHQIIQHASSIDNNISFRIHQDFDSIGRSGYILEIVSTDINLKIGLFIKQCQSRRPPWRYTFDQDHQAQIDLMQECYEKVFILLIANEKTDRGIICLDYEDLKQLLDNNHEPVEWISVDKNLRTQYQLSGKDGKLNKKISRQDFPRLIVNSIDKMIQQISW